ncbi:hypothetical protein B0H19DRAFT_1250414 [Mycena capillaripes]|nr:hypothetical protein B0H19DRAFT_1250414 [Mycena capillaripes]
MRFNFLSIATVLVSLATTVSAQGKFCPEASRFGNLNVSPTTLSPGKTFTAMANLTCAVQLGNTPTFLDYFVSGTSTHAMSGPILIARRTYNHATSPPIDKFTAVFYFEDA